MANCRSCNAEIEWVETKTGKQMPLDVAESVCKKCEGRGRLGLMGSDGAWVECVTCGGAGMLRLSHFATCPTAEQHRKAKA